MSDEAARAFQALLRKEGFSLPHDVEIEVVVTEAERTLEVQGQSSRKLRNPEWIAASDRLAEVPDIFDHDGIQYDVDIGRIPS